MIRPEPGQKVRLLFDVVNDGTLYGKPRGALLQKQGDLGYVKELGWFLDSEMCNIHFLESDQVIGCRFWEIIDAQTPWQPPAFSKGEQIQTTVPLSLHGKIIAPSGAFGQIHKIRYQQDWGYVYQINIEGDPMLYVIAEPQLQRKPND